MTPLSSKEDLQFRIKYLEEQIAEHKWSDQKISALSVVCSLLGINHHKNIQIIVDQTFEILSGTCALYRRSDGKTNRINTWSGSQPDNEIAEQMFFSMLHSCMSKHEKADEYNTFENSCDPQVTNEYVPKENLSDDSHEQLSCLSVAVSLKKKIIGSLSLFDIKPRQFSVTDKRILSTLAKAIAIEEERNISKIAIQKSEERYRTILDDIKEGYYEVDLKGSFLFVSETFCEIFGYTEHEVIGRNYMVFATPETAEKAYTVFNNVYSTGQPAREVAWEIPGKDGIQKYLESSISLIKDQDDSPIGFRGIVRDITKQRMLEFQLQQAQKLEAIGTLAGGIAHDFNNILCIILGNTDSALANESESKTIRENLRDIRIAAQRGSEVIKQIQTFSRNQEVSRYVVRLTPILKESFTLLRATIPKNIKIELDIDCKQDTVVADATQIHQILINLSTNAAHAMQDVGSGLLEISLRNKKLKKLINSPIPPGLYVILQVRDTGIGIAEENLPRIFDPYFTTKEIGKGTGMGLAIVHGIVHTHNGDITVSSLPGYGTTFKVYLPVTYNQPTSPIKSTVLDIVGNERILVVDDEEALANTMKKNLARVGYKVTIATVPDMALTMFKDNPDQFDLVILDMIMPGMKGDKLAMALMKIQPDIPIILCTGHSTTITEYQIKQMGIKELVFKPFRFDQLALIIRDILGPVPNSKES